MVTKRGSTRYNEDGIIGRFLSRKFFKCIAVLIIPMQTSGCELILYPNEPYEFDLLWCKEFKHSIVTNVIIN